MARVHALIPLLSLALARPAVAGTVQGPDCPASVSAPRFVWHSGFWLNLHSFIHHTAKLRRGIHNDAPAAIAVVFAESAGTRALTGPEQAQWEAALRYYLTTPLAMGMADSAVQRVNEQLARAADDGDLDDVTIDAGLRQTLTAIAPVYRAVWWPEHDRHNREWMAQLEQVLAGREACVSDAVQRSLGTSWPDSAVIVDVSVYATWFGAYSTHHPTHITLSSNGRGNQGTLGVETLFHEAGHGITGALDSALAASAAQAHRALPSELGHLILFFTVGQVVARYYPGHVPYAEALGLWNQNDAARSYRALLTREWQPYLDGRRTFADAVRGIIQSLPSRSTE